WFEPRMAWTRRSQVSMDSRTQQHLPRPSFSFLPYGSAVPVDAWPSIHAYLQTGGNLLILGGQPFRVPVTASDGKFVPARPQDTYSRVLDFRHTYEVPRRQSAMKFAWRAGYSFLRSVGIRAQRFFAIEGHL